MSLGVYNKIGLTGFQLIDNSRKRMSELSQEIEGQEDLEELLKTKTEIKKQKASMVQGMYFVKTYYDLTDSMLQLFGIGRRCNCRC